MKNLLGYKIEHITSDGMVLERLVAKTKDEAEEVRADAIASGLFPIKGSKWKISPVYR